MLVLDTLKGCQKYIQDRYSTAYNPSEGVNAKLSDEQRLAANFAKTCQQHKTLSEHAEKGWLSKLVVSIVSGADPKEIFEKLKADKANEGLSKYELLQKAEENRKAANASNRLQLAITGFSSLSGLVAALTSGGGLFQSLYGIISSLSMPFLFNSLLAKALHYCPNQGLASTVETLGNFFGYQFLSNIMDSTVGQAFASFDGRRGGNQRNMAAYSQMPAMRGGGLTSLAR
jgi:hypothetical protein